MGTSSPRLDTPRAGTALLQRRRRQPPNMAVGVKGASMPRPRPSGAATDGPLRQEAGLGVPVTPDQDGLVRVTPHLD